MPKLGRNSAFQCVRSTYSVFESLKSIAKASVTLQKFEGPLLTRYPRTMQEPTLHSIQQARKLLGGISRNTIYQLLRSGQLASVVIGCRRFIARAAIDELIARSTTTISPSRASTRSRLTGQVALPLPLPSPRRGRFTRAEN